MTAYSESKQKSYARNDTCDTHMPFCESCKIKHVLVQIMFSMFANRKINIVSPKAYLKFGMFITKAFSLDRIVSRKLRKYFLRGEDPRNIETSLSKVCCRKLRIETKRYRQNWEKRFKTPHQKLWAYAFATSSCTKLVPEIMLLKRDIQGHTPNFNRTAYQRQSVWSRWYAFNICKKDNKKQNRSITGERWISRGHFSNSTHSLKSFAWGGCIWRIRTPCM